MSMTRWKHLLSGFTLVELMVVVAIVSMLSVVGIVSYNSFSNKQQIVQAGRTMKEVLRDAQSRAFTGEYAGCPTPPNTLKGWQVDFSNSSMAAVCTIPVAQPTVKYDLRAIVTVTAPNPLIFTSFPKGTNNPSTISVCLTQPEITPPYYKINVDPNGNINDIGRTPLCP